MTAGKTVDKCEGLRVEHAFSHRYQCLKTKARAIFIINHKHPYYRAWRRGLICSFSPLSVSLPPLISLLLREQADGTSRSVDRHGAGWQSRGLSTPRYVWVTAAGISLARVPLQRPFQGSLMGITVAFSISCC